MNDRHHIDERANDYGWFLALAIMGAALIVATGVGLGWLLWRVVG